MISFVIVGLGTQLVSASLLESTSEAERIIDQRYATERSHRMALKKLDAILENATLSDADKESRIQEEFLASAKLTAENAGDLLLYTPILSWRIHSLAVAYDLNGRYESIVSRDRLTGAKTSQAVGLNEEKSRSENRTSTGEMSGSLHAEVGLSFGAIPKPVANAEARVMKTVSNTSSTGNQSAWSRQDQASLDACYESVMKELSETKLSGLHIRFVVEFSNNTEKDMIVPAESVIPVYAGAASFSVMAKMESVVPLNIPAHGTVDISFRGDLATTAARELIDFMRTKSPIISPERSPLLIIRSTDGTIRNAVNEAMRVAYARIVCGSYTWNVRKTWGGKSVSLQQAFEAVNSRYDIAPFVWEGLKLKELCGATVELFDLKKIPCVETGDGISIGFNDISKSLTLDEIHLGVMNADQLIVGKERRWNELTKESQNRLIARLHSFKNDAAVQYLLGVCYEYGLGVDKSAEKAAECYRKSANGGDPRGQYEYGQCFDYGWGGVEQSSTKAVEWYRKAAEQGNAIAQGDLGVCYANGTGVEKSAVEAVKWYRKAAEQGNAVAQSNLGLRYYYGQGVEQSYVESAKWFKKSAEQGNAVAQYNLGVCYEYGQGVVQSYVEAVRWYRKAAELGNATAQYNLGVCYEYGQGVVRSYAEAVRWYRKAAEQGDAAAQCNLGVCYEYGKSVAQSYADAVKWYRKAAEQGDATAQCNLGVSYEYGRGIGQSYAEAVKWYRVSAEQGYVAAQCNLGICYAKGCGVQQSYADAVKWFHKSAKQGYAAAQHNLGVCYDNGQGVQQSYAEAVRWYSAAAEQGHANAQYNLGISYAEGSGCEKSVKLAMYWLRKAEENGMELDGRVREYMKAHKDE